MSPEILLAGSIGALAVFGLGALRDFRQSRRELRGLARLIHTEITHNRMSLGGFYRSLPRRPRKVSDEGIREQLLSLSGSLPDERSS